MFKVRNDEPDYAFLSHAQAPDKNQYGDDIDLSKRADTLIGKSLNINGDSGIGENPDRYKQHGFYFNADNCISCHACESACSEKNNLPPYLAYRSVGYVEGGSYPSYTRLNISMACNHCDDPVCLKGCPTRAYTKFAEYGAVLQDPDICFGCGYCTWVCPYNAPQLDTEKGHVHKCNMCVDRLEVGLKPACASACLAGALDFGVIETKPANRDQLKTQIPGFPTPSITHPNIRFQQTKTLPQEMTRTDSIDVKYRLNKARTGYIPVVDEAKASKVRQWNLKKLLSSHENAHIAFTLSVQAVIGAFLILLASRFLSIESLSTVSTGASSLSILIVCFLLMSFGMLKLNLHLGRPQRFYRGFYNLRHSPVSREIAGVSLFFAGLSGYGFLSLFQNNVIQILATVSAVTAIIGAVVGLYYMYKLYRIPARPFWDHWQTGSSFVGTALSLGGTLVLLLTLLSNDLSIPVATIKLLSIIILCGLVLEGVGLIAHAYSMKRAQHEGVLSHYEQRTRYGKSYWLRNIALITSVVLMTTIYYLNDQIISYYLGGLFIVSLLITAIIGRALFYILVIPTTMPGAFFWRNKGFEDHARETGLAAMPQVGVLPSGH